MIRVFAVHTATALIDPITALFKEILPEVKLNHIADDSLIQEVIANNCVTPMVKKRLLNYYYAAVDGGADYIFNTCSSIGEVAINARNIIPIPIIKIDDAMAIMAVESASTIAVIATLPTTLSPTASLLKSIASAKGKKIEIIEGLAKGAFEAVMSGDRDKHDSLIMEASMSVASKADLIVLAQGSMARMEEQLSAATGKIVLSSPRLGVQSLKEMISKK